MADSTPTPLTVEQVRHVATLARLRLSEAQVEMYQRQLAAVLGHIATLSKLDVRGVEPMAHPTNITNRLDDDQVAPPMPIDNLRRNAPAMEDRYLAVPKVLADEPA